MKTLLLTVNYVADNADYWADSYLKNTPVRQRKDETINDTIARALYESEGCKLSYNNKPQADMYRDVKDKAAHIGYIYRGVINIPINGRIGRALFDVWVEISEVTELPLVSCEK